MGLTVLGPDVNESRDAFTPVTLKDGRGAIRFGLAGIKGVGEAASQRIIAERGERGPFADFEDFVRRVDTRALNKRVLEHLVKTGAFDFSGAPRKRLFDGIDAALGAASAHARDRAAGQDTFLDMLADAAPPARGPRGPAGHAGGAGTGDDFTPEERLQFEKELLGFYISGHPMNVYEGLAEALDTFDATALLEQPDRTEFRLCGIVGNLAKKLSKKDNRPWMAFTLATRRASLPLNMFADAFAAYGHHLAENAAVAVLGTILKGDDGARINVKECYPLDAHVAAAIRRVTWLLAPDRPDTADFLVQLRETLNRHSGDTRSELGFVFEERFAPVAEASSALGWRVSATAFQTLRRHPAVAGVQIEARRLELREQKRWGRKG
jgi:DNA polymerase-3 subunit alpha